VLPLVFMLLLGIIWFGRAYNIYSTIQQAAQQGAITAARNLCATCGNTTAPDGTITSCPETGAAGSVAYAVANVMCASSIDPTQIPVSSNPPTPISCVNPPALVTCTTPGNITICRQALLNSPPVSATQPSQCGVIVSFQYPFQFYLPFTSLNMQTITLSAQAQSRMEN
jgi:Flp pilus assembly protein TadG